MLREANRDPLLFLESSVKVMEEAQLYRLETRAPLERLSADMFWRGVAALCRNQETT